MENKETEDKYISRRKFIGGTLAALVACSEAQAFFKGSIIDRVFISGPKERKAEKALNEYAGDGYLTGYEKEQVLKIIDNKKLREKINETETRLKIEAEKRSREEEKRKKALASQAYKRAVDAKKHDDYHSARSNINEAIKKNPNHIGYKVYKDYINGSEKAKQDWKEVKREVGDGLEKAGGWLENKLYRLKKKLRR